jgi:hypothetical protein
VFRISDLFRLRITSRSKKTRFLEETWFLKRQATLSS